MSNALTINNNAMAIPVIADDLNSYMSKIATIDLLTVEEEQSLARRLRDSEDLDAARQLVMSQLRFVVHIARTYKGYGLPMADLIQEGNIGLMKAVKRFDPDVGCAVDLFRGALDPGRDPRVCHQELAHRESGDNQIPAQAVLQVAQREKATQLV